MKKIFWLGSAALIMLFSPGCKKEEASSPGSNLSYTIPALNRTVEDIIASTDTKYGTHYSLRKSSSTGDVINETNADVKIIHGLWVFGNDIENGWCDKVFQQCICCIIITSAERSSKPSKDVILNDNDSPVLIKRVVEIKSDDVLNNKGEILRTNYEFIH